MAKNGFVHIIPVIAIAVILVGGVGVVSLKTEQSQKEAVGKVLSSSDDNEGSDKEGDSSGPGPAGTTKIESRTDESRTKIETSTDETKVEVRSKEGRFETRVEEGREETKIRTGRLRIEIRREGNQVVTKIKNEADEEVELEDEEEDELLLDIEEELEEDGIRLATDSAQPGFIQFGRRVRTNFPLSVNAETGELMVSTPAGDKIVAVLPEVAITNMIKAGILTRVVEEPPPPVEGTASAIDTGGIELTTVANQPVYLISGIKIQNFLGLVPVNFKIKTVVSAETGQLLDIQQGIFARVLDLFSF